MSEDTHPTGTDHIVQHKPKTKRQEILEEALKCVTKDRNATHGEPENNFQTIADLWNAYLGGKARQGKGVIPSLTSHDVAVLNILQKVARVVSTPYHTDHWVDIAGYAACGGGIPVKS